MSHSSRLQRGVSLIEALVAFAVLAFGMLGVVGMQSTMRSNADMARQRAEAVRLAQDAVEEWRGFTTLATTANRTAYQDVTGESSRSVVGTNATYTVSRRALTAADVSGTVTPDRQGVVVDVSWQDRAGQTQMVRLGSAVSGSGPELGASLVLATGTEPLVKPQGRSRSIPNGAVPLGVGRSGLVPPGQGGGDHIAWVFDNSTALITVCTTSVTNTGDLTPSNVTCGDEKALLISGFVRYVDGEPTYDSVVNPAWLTGQLPLGFGLSVSRSILDPHPVRTVACYQGALSNSAVPYYCAVGITTDYKQWSGKLEFGSPLNIANSVTDVAAGLYKVCRYQTTAIYFGVGSALTNQNFVIINSGSGSTVYRCPTAGTPQRTWEHQPH